MTTTNLYAARFHLVRTPLYVAQFLAGFLLALMRGPVHIVRAVRRFSEATPKRDVEGARTAATSPTDT